jgi:hypothetical protein
MRDRVVRASRTNQLTLVGHQKASREHLELRREASSWPSEWVK